MRRSAVTVALAVALHSPTAVAQQGGWRDEAEQRLKSAAQSMTDRGYELTRVLRIDSLSDQDNATFTITLHAGTAYAMVGVCDSDCRDLDLALYDVAGTEVDSDAERDDVPIVRVTPSETMRYRIKVVMANCQRNPCRYGIGVYGK